MHILKFAAKNNTQINVLQAFRKWKLNVEAIKRHEEQKRIRMEKRLARRQ